MHDVQPVSGWVLNLITYLDVHCPGLAGSFLRASPERRQVIASLLAITDIPKDAAGAKELGDFAMRADHRSIIVRAFGSVPVGLRGALARSGHQPHARDFYRTLHKTLSQDDRLAQAIRRLNKVDANRLRVARLLPEHVLTPSLISIIVSPAMARDVTTMILLLEDKGIDRKALAPALASLTSVEQFPSFWERWASKVAFPPHPVPQSARYLPIMDGAALSSLAKRYSNCARTYLEKALRGEAAFGEYAHPLGSAVVHLVRKGDEWVLEGLFGPSNRTAPPHVRDAAVRHLRVHGIVDKFGRRTGLDWSALRRLTAMSMFDFAFD